MTAAPTRRLATIVALDMAGYSARTAADEVKTAAEVAALRAVIEAAAQVRGGRIFNTAGDGFMLEFPSSMAAVEAAAELAATCEPKVRVGVHLGDVLVQPDGDLLGHGVNVAARLMARSDPGSTLVSADVRRTLRGALAERLTAIGQVELDKMSETIEAFALDASATATTPAARASARPGKPSIAVLPFANLSGDAGQDYFVDGMMEEITTAMSRIRSIFVIASTSTQSFRTAPVSAEAAGHQLGVRYLLEGSVRKAVDRIRIVVKLIEVTDGRQVWAERYDGTVDDVFALQERVALNVAGVIEPTVLNAEMRRVSARPTTDIGAYDLYLQALSLVDTYEREPMFAALERLERAIAIDPLYARAISLAAYAHAQIVVTGWSDDAEAHRRLAVELVGRAVQMAGDDAEVLAWATGAYLPIDEDIEGAITLIDRALMLNPGCAQAWLMSGWLRVTVGESERAIEDFETAMRLDPCSTDRGYQISGIAVAKFHGGRFDEAARLLNEAHHLQPTVSINVSVLAACLGHLGRIKDARKAMTKYARLTSVDIHDRTNLFRRPEHLRSYRTGIAMAEGKDVAEGRP
jgi:adenylate cyclase